jgi:hypothetical protein
MNLALRWLAGYGVIAVMLSELRLRSDKRLCSRAKLKLRKVARQALDNGDGNTEG